MRNHLLVIAGSVVAAAMLAALPAVIGLIGNPSFSHQLPVHVPSQARSVHLVDGSSVVSVAPAPSPSPTGSEPGDDRRATTTAPATDSRGGPSGRRGPDDDARDPGRAGGSIGDSSTGGSSGDGRHGGHGTGHS